jgi:hypothetical protein
MTTTKKILGGTALAMLLTTGAAFAQTYDTTGSSTNATNTGTTNVDTSNAVGTPNTGSGGDMAMNIALLGGSAAVAVVGGTLLMRRRYW